MKRVIFVAFIGLLAIIWQSCKKQNPAEYNDKIINEQIAITEKIEKMKKAIDDFNLMSDEKQALANMDSAYNSLVFQIDSSIAKVSAMENFKDDSTLKQAALELFNEYKNLTSKYKRIIELYKIPDEMFTAENSKEIDSLANEIETRSKNAFNKFLKVQKDFAEKYNLNLIKKE